jgi:hypothetical protein
VPTAWFMWNLSRTDTASQRGGVEWMRSDKFFSQGDRGSNNMNTTSNTRLRLNCPSWSRPHRHWSAPNPRNQQTTFRAKTHQHTQRKLARHAACATPVRPMACAGQTGDTGQTGGCSSRTTNVPERLGDFSRPWTQKPPKHNLHGRKTLHKS